MMTDATAIHRAQLADMPLATICAWLKERGWDVCLDRACRLDRLPPGYPPPADGDDYTPERLPFDNDRDGR